MNDIDENSGEYHTDDQSSLGAANMDEWVITGIWLDAWVMTHENVNKNYIDDKLITVTLLPFTTTGPPNN